MKMRAARVAAQTGSLPGLTSSVILPTRGYGVKEICKHESLVNFEWELNESGSQWTVVRYNDYLNCSDPESREAIKQEILTYNRDDVRATRALEKWHQDLALPDTIIG